MHRTVFEDFRTDRRLGDRALVAGVVPFPRRHGTVGIRSGSFLGKCRHEQSLDGVHAVFRLFEYDRVGRLENLLRHLEAVDEIRMTFADRPGDLRFGVVKGGKTVHEPNVGVPGRSKETGIYLIGIERPDALVSDVGRLAHGHPDIRV